MAKVIDFAEKRAKRAKRASEVPELDITYPQDGEVIVFPASRVRRERVNLPWSRGDVATNKWE